MGDQEDKEMKEEDGVERELDNCWGCFRHLEVECVFLVSVL